MKFDRKKLLDYFRLTWMVITCLTIVLIVIGIILDWSVLVILWMIIVEVFITFILNFLYRVEMQLEEEKDRADRIENSKGDYLANMSHEIRTPMNAIVGMCELTLREKDISETVKDNCKNIQSSGRSLLSIINDILDYSKIDSGKMEIIEEDFNINETLNDVINMAMTRKGEKGIQILVKVDSSIPKGLYGDELRIRQIMINIMTNAVKYTKKGGAVLSVSCTKQDYGVNLNISVSDTGIGISEENLRKLFVSFQQVDTKKNRSVEGTGLGLAISKKLVQSMGGFINVRSKLNKGSEFRITIPLKVTNTEPLIKVKNAKDLHVVSFINYGKYSDITVKTKYKEILSSFGKSLGVDYHNFVDFDSLRDTIDVFLDQITHCFVEKEEYLNYKGFFDKLSECMNVVLIQDKAHAITPGGNIRSIYKPFYLLQFAAALNNESMTSINDHAFAGARFIAPKAHVLIVDDNELNREVAVGLMKPYKLNLYTAANAKEAFEIIKEKQMNVVFMDHMMPEIDGVEATQMIRSWDDPYFKRLPIIALTANAINGVKEIFLEAGFDDFMPKPIEIPTLDRMLKHWIPDKYLEKPKQEEDANKTVAPVIMAKDYAINIENGMYYTGGDLTAYKYIVSIFIKNGYTTIEEMNLLFMKEEWHEYQIEAHALKSSSLTIGANKLSEYAKDMEMACKEGKYDIIKSKHIELMEVYKLVIEGCENYLLENPIEIEPEEENALAETINLEPEYEFIIEYLEKIIEACDNFDNEEIGKLCNGALASVGNNNDIRSYITKIGERGEDFEYDGAKELAEELLSKIK